MAFTRIPIAACVVLLSFLALVSHAQPSMPAKVSHARRTRPVEDKPVPVEDVSVRAAYSLPEEKEGDAITDLEFDKDISTDTDRPATLPTLQQAQKVYESQKRRVVSEAKKSGDDSLKTASLRTSPAFHFHYLSPETWPVKPVSKCCPASVKYACTESSSRLPCFSSYTSGVREWCCPIWPSVYIKRCTCSQCAVLTKFCAHEGRCQRRYSRRSFLAVCYRNHQWGFLRYITRYLPTSCQCRIG